MWREQWVITVWRIGKRETEQADLPDDTIRLQESMSLTINLIEEL